MIITGEIAKQLFEEGRLDGVLGPLGSEARRWWNSGLLMSFNGLPLYLRSFQALAPLVLEGPRPPGDGYRAWPPLWTGSILLCSRDRIPKSSPRDREVINVARQMARKVVCQ